MPARNEIRENPGGRRLLVRAITRRGASPEMDLWGCLQLNGRYAGQPFGAPARDLDSWTLLATLPPEGNHDQGADDGGPADAA